MLSIIYYLFVFVKDTASRLKATVNDASNLLDIYYSVGSLVLIKVIIWSLLYSLSLDGYVIPGLIRLLREYCCKNEGYYLFTPTVWLIWYLLFIESTKHSYVIFRYLACYFFCGSFGGAYLDLSYDISTCASVRESLCKMIWYFYKLLIIYISSSTQVILM